MSTGYGVLATGPEAKLVAGLQAVGYFGSLLEENYAFPDWFAKQHERVAVAAAFGQTPVSYESACIGVARADTSRGQDLVNSFRSLGAPILLEIDNEEIREWAVSHVPNGHRLLATFRTGEIENAFAQRATEWKRENVLRAKNIGLVSPERQLGIFSGLLPELENQIQSRLDPMLRQTLAQTRDAYKAETGREANRESLFKLVFWTLTAKVFHDRGVNGFAGLSADSDVLLRAVARQYKKELPRLLTKDARQTAANLIWDDLDFRNLSVEVLSQIWSTTLVEKDTRREQGIHRTPRSIVRYILNRVPFSTGDDNRIVFEPCCGSAAFLIGAMQKLREQLFGASPTERHRYFVNRLAGTEFDPFGTEISSLALTLADFPNPNGWKIKTADVFTTGAMTDDLRHAGVVLCNPPFEDFDEAQRAKYRPSSVKKPAELLGRVLDDLHPSGVLGFVLPVLAMDGRGYAHIRERLARRFASLEFTILPDRAFDEADAETALLVATEPIPHELTSVSYRRVRDDAESWEAFSHEHRVSVEHTAKVAFTDARKGFTIPDLPDVWAYLRHYETLADVANVHRGIQWNLPTRTNKSLLVRGTKAPGYWRGVPPLTKFNVFETPPMAYLSLRPEHQRRDSWRLPWNKPKAILNKSTRSRGSWRIAAFADSEGVACHQTYNGVWPKTEEYDEVVLAAVLNSPLANAFVATREGKTDITLETLRLMPMPVLLEAQRESLHVLVDKYRAAIALPLFGPGTTDDSERLLKEIDAIVLDGYRMPPRIERQLLDFFRGERRPVQHTFSNYFPDDFEVFFSLSDYLDPRTTDANAASVLRLIAER